MKFLFIAFSLVTCAFVLSSNRISPSIAAELEIDGCNEINAASGSGLAEGNALINFTGDTPPFTLSWSGPTPGNLVENDDGSAIIQDLLPGNYQLTITDNGGLSVNCSFTISINEMCATNLGCNDNIEVVLDDNCQAVLSPLDLMEGELGCLTEYAFEVSIIDDNPDNGPIVDGIGTFIYEIELIIPSGGVGGGFTNCWGYLLTSDDVTPSVTCPANTDQAILDQEFQEIQGTLSSNDPTFQAGLQPCWSEHFNPQSGEHYYNTCNFTVTTDDVYTFDLYANGTPGDWIGGLFQYGFSEEMPCENIISQNDEQLFTLGSPLYTGLFTLQEDGTPLWRITVPLEAEVSYTLVTTSIQAGSTGNFSWKVYSHHDGSLNSSCAGVTQATTRVQELLCSDLDSILVDNLGPTIPRCYRTDSQGNIIFPPSTVERQRIETLLNWLTPTGLPTTTDNCGYLEICVEDDFVEDGDCGDITITRTFTVTDQQGDYVSDGSDNPPNQTSCAQIITLRQPQVLDVVTPPLTSLVDNQQSFETDANGNPHPNVSGYPFVITAFDIYNLDQSYCNLGASYSDFPSVDLGDNAYEFQREWNVIDWCTPEDNYTYQQTIKVGTFTPPEITCPFVDLDQDGSPDGILTYSTGPFDCTASFAVPSPEITGGCGSTVTIYPSLITYITVEVLDSLGNPTGQTETEEVVIQTLTSTEIDLANPPPTLGFVMGIPLGCHYFRYRIVDDCNNETTQDCQFFVEDQVEPVAICDDDLNISIGGQGYARVYTDDIDEGSWDNCGPIRIEVRRLYNEDPQTCAPVPPFYSDWGEYVDFNCCDVNEIAYMEIRVWDDRNSDGIPGNTITRVNCNGTTESVTDNNNVCWLEILVEDKINPFCAAPHDLEQNCSELPPDFDPFDTTQLQSLFGEAEASDNCTDATWEELTPTVNIQGCGAGTITRFFQATDAVGNMSTNTCQQVVTILEVPSAGTISSAPETSFICAGSGISTFVSYDSTGTNTENYTYIITNAANVIVTFITGDTFDWSTLAVGDYRVWGLTYTGNLLAGPGDDLDIDDLSNDYFDLSDNYIETTVGAPDGGSITANGGAGPITLVVGDGNADLVSFDSIGTTSDSYQYIVTDDNNLILAFSEGGIIDFDAAAPGTCRVWGLAYTGNITAQGGDDLTLVPLSDDCFDLSDNFIEINRQTEALDHDYSIRFPKDADYSCGTTLLDTISTATGNGCDLLAITTDDEAFSASGDECYKIFRTYRVINWCEYNEEPEPVIVGRDEDCDGMPGDEAIYVIVRSNADTPGQTDVFYDRDQDEGNANPPASSKSPSCDGLTNPTGYWISTDIDQNATPVRDIGSIGYWQYTQIIKVYDTSVPVITPGAFDPFCSLDNVNCDGAIAIPFSLEDCTPDDITLIVSLDLSGNGTIDYEVQMNQNGVLSGDTDVFTISGAYPDYNISGTDIPIGDHAFEVQASEGCGNQSTGEIPFEVVDCKAPSPICINGLAIELMPTEPGTDADGDGDVDPGAMALWAIDFIASPVSDCSEPVTYSMNRAGETPDIDQNGIVVTCDDPETLIVEIYAWDAAGNFDFCETYILVQDNMFDLCSGPAEASISGRVLRDNGEPVADAEISLSGGANQTTQSNNMGIYGFTPLPVPEDYTVTPAKDTGPEECLSVTDMAIIHKHIIFTHPFTTPYQYIAANVSNSQGVSTFDIVLLSKLVLTEAFSFDNNTSWRFVDASYDLAGYPESFPEVINVSNLTDVATNQDFTAIKIGDLNYCQEKSSQELISLSTENLTTQTGESIAVDIMVENAVTIEGIQFTLDWDDSLLSFTAIENESGPLSSSRYYLPSNNRMTIVDQGTKTFAGGETLLTLYFDVISPDATTTSINFSSSPTDMEATDTNLQPFSIGTTSGTITIEEAAIIDTVRTYFDDLEVTVDETFCVPVTTENYNAVLGMRFTMNYDPNILEFVGVSDLNNALEGFSVPANFGTPNSGTSPGFITVNYFDQELTANTLADGSTLFELCFTVINCSSNCTDLQFTGDIAAIEFSDAADNAMPHMGFDGSVCIEDNNAITTIINDTLCPGGNRIINGNFYTESNPSGTEVTTAANGCDSTIIVDLSFYQPAHLDIVETLCPGESLTVNGTVYNETNPTGNELLLATNGCDSTITVDLSFITVQDSTLERTLCPGESLTVNGTIYDEGNPSGTEMVTTGDGCDSTVFVALSFFAEAETLLNPTLCPGEVLPINGTVYNAANPTGVEIISAANGCDSTITIDLSFYAPITTAITETLCPGESIAVGNTTYDENTPTGTETFPAANGCDSIVEIDLSFFSNPIVNISATICQGQSYSFDGNLLTTTGSYQGIFMDGNGCDSTVNLALTVTETLSTSFSATICPGDTYVWNDVNYDTPGEYEQDFTTAEGCDSIVTLVLNQHPLPEILTGQNTVYTSCEGEAFPVIELNVTDGATIDWYASLSGNDLLTQGSTLFTPTEAGTVYAQVYNPATGCINPQRTMVEIIRHPVAVTNLQETTCQLANVETDTLTLTTVNGCDSLVITNITFELVIDTTFSTATSCLLEDVGLDTLVLQSVEGCDSVAVVNTTFVPLNPTLVINYTCQFAEVAMVTDTLTSSEGCDSIVIFDRRFDPAYTAQLPDEITCDTNLVGIDSTIISLPNGCDSLLLQSWLPGSATTVAVDTFICEGEDLLFGDKLLTTTGAYTDTINTVQGCDSIIELTLTVIASDTTILDEYLCEGDSYTFGDEEITEPGVYIDILENTWGCDSIVVLTLEEQEAQNFVVNDDEYVIIAGETSAKLQLLDNDQLPNVTWSINLTEQPAHGSATLLPEGELDYQLTDLSFLGVDSFAYQICTYVCDEICLEANIAISTLRDCQEELEANLPTGFTPDGDGVNDLFDPIAHVTDIGCLQNPGNAQLTIISRWGEIVYQPDSYQAWDGRFNNGQLVPQDVYYYILRFELEEEVVLREEVHVLRGKY